LNRKSATSIINKSTSKDFSIENFAREAAKTSDDPKTPPSWEKVSSSNSYAWHDHRTHFMGTVPSDSIDLGGGNLPVLVDSKIHQVSFSFTAGNRSQIWILVLAS